MDNLDDDSFQLFKDLIYQASGITFCDVNRVVLESRLKEIMRERKFHTLLDYFDLCRSNPDELKLLLDAVTTNLTRFFRNTAHFDALINYVIPNMLKYKAQTGDRTFRFWSAGCSTGEECYSVAMVLKELLPADFQIKVIGSDISLSSLEAAQIGRYRADKMKDVPNEYLEKYFDRDGDFYVVGDILRKIVSFDYHNLKNRPMLMNNDVVFCRNVLIYFDDPAQENVVNLIYDTMSPYSFFFIGHSESLFGMSTPFKFLKTDWACIYSKNIKEISFDD